MNINTRTGQFENDNRGYLTVTTNPDSLTNTAKVTKLLMFHPTLDPTSLAAGAATTLSVTATGVRLADVIIGCQCKDNTVANVNPFWFNAVIDGSDSIKIYVENRHASSTLNIPSAEWSIAVLQAT